MAFLHEDDHNHTDERAWRRGQILVGTSKGNPTGEFIIVAKFSGYA